MSIWEYSDRIQDKELITEGYSLSNCLFCKTQLLLLLEDNQKKDRKAPDYYVEDLHAEFCPTCGWWRAGKSVRLRNAGGRCSRIPKLGYASYGAVAILRNLDLISISTPIEEIRNFLVAKYESRYDVHPRLFEETVASVFRDLDYQAKVTAYSGDGGIDIVLVGKDSSEIGVQVKRYKNSISVEQIRSFTGALVLSGYTKGIFVTTSRFQSGASKTTKLAGLRGVQIDLLNAERFYDALKITQRAIYRNTGDLIDQLMKQPLTLLTQNTRW